MAGDVVDVLADLPCDAAMETGVDVKVEGRTSPWRRRYVAVSDPLARTLRSAVQRVVRPGASR